IAEIRIKIRVTGLFPDDSTKEAKKRNKHPLERLPGAYNFSKLLVEQIIFSGRHHRQCVFCFFLRRRMLQPFGEQSAARRDHKTKRKDDRQGGKNRHETPGLRNVHPFKHSENAAYLSVYE